MWKKNNNLKRWGVREFCWAVLILIAISLAGTFGRTVTFIDLLLTCLPQQEILHSPNILVVGIDSTDGVRRSDTIMILKMHDQSRKINMISIPRDSYVHIPRYGYDKINHAYAYGGIRLLQVTAEEFLRLNIHRYLRLSLNDLRYIINVLGGVELDVERRMYYVDKAGGLYINLYPGQQRLNSDQAMGYIRYRNTVEGDIGRTRRQQKLIQAIFQEAVRPLNLFKIPKIITHLRQRLHTDLRFKEMIWLGAHLKKAYDTQQLFQATLPGKEIYINGVSYWDVDRAAATIILQKALNPAIRSRSQRQKPLSLKIEVLNGNGLAGSAEKIAGELKKIGVSVTKIDNAAHFHYRKSQLVIWYRKDNATKRLRSYLGIGPRHVKVKQIKKPIYATLVLGRDWERVLNTLREQQGLP